MNGRFAFYGSSTGQLSAGSVIIRTKAGGGKWERIGDGLSEATRSFAGAITFDESSLGHLYTGSKSDEIYANGDYGDLWARLDVEVASISGMKCVQCFLSRDQSNTPLSHCQETSNGIITSVLALSARADCTGPTCSAQGGVDSSA